MISRCYMIRHNSFTTMTLPFQVARKYQFGVAVAIARFLHWPLVGTSRHFATIHQVSRLRSDADIQQATIQNRI